MSFRRPAKDEVLTLKVPVVIDKPIDGGNTKGHEIEVTYELPRQSALDDFLARVREGDDSLDLAREVVLRLDRIEEEDGTLVKYLNDKATAKMKPDHPDYDALVKEVRDDIVDITYARAAIMRDFWKLVNGQRVKARRGN